MRRRLLLVIAMVAAAPVVKAEQITKKTFPNGLIWIHKPVQHNSIMAFHLMMPSGSWVEPAEKAGITTLMTSVMFKGTFNRTSLQIAQEAESLGAQLDASCEAEFWEMSGQTTVDKFDATLDIFMDVLQNPSFPQEEFDKEKEALLNAIQSKKEQIFNIAFERLQKEVFGDHPYGRPEEGTEETVKRIVREDMPAWNQKVAVPQGAVFVTVGAYPSKRLAALIARTLGQWESPVTKRLPHPALAPLAASKSAEETYPFEQSYFMLGYRAPGILSADYAAVKLLNAHLGAGMSSPLFHVVREQEGLAYEVSSFFPSRQEGSAFIIYAGTDPKNLDRAQQKVKSMIADFLKTPMPENELEDAKQFVRGHYAMDHQTNGRIAWYLGWWEILGKGSAYDERYLADVSKTTAADMARIAKNIFESPEVTVKILSKKK